MTALGPKMTTLQSCVKAVIAKHGGLNAAARACRVDKAYLSRLSSGTKREPSNHVLRRLGIIKVVAYECAATIREGR